MEENKYDFYNIGCKYAEESCDLLRKKAEEIGKRFGRKARQDFELGIAATIPQYNEFYNLDNDNLKEEMGHSLEGVPNLRNNSYFGGDGVSQRYLIKPNGEKIYNESRINKPDNSLEK